MTEPASTGVRFTPRKLPAKDAAAYVAAEPRDRAVPLRGARHRARARGRGAQAPLARRHGRADRRRDAASYRTSDDNLDWLAMRIAMLGYEYEVHGPPELVERLGEIAARIGRATPGRTS